MKYAAFETLAFAEWERIPDDYRAGVDGLVIERDAKPDPERTGVFILGECLTDSYPSAFEGPDTIRSELVLYYGSFRRLAAQDDSFDWQVEVFETLTHELRHHLESLAGRDDLDEVDHGLREHHRRMDGDAFDPFYFRRGERRPGRWFVLEHAWFLEVRADNEEHMRFEWNGTTYAVPMPGERADVLFLDVVDGVPDAPDELCIVVVKPRGILASLRDAVRRRRLEVAEATVTAENAG
jgi:hypothetical protein